MNFFEKFIHSIETEMPTPPEWGTWHLVSIALTIVASIVLGLLMRKASNKALRIYLIVHGAILIIFEILKQCVFHMSVVDGKAVWDMQWYIFPFHFCSLAMYISLIAGIVKPGKVQDTLLAFLSTFGILAGFIVMIIPSQVLCPLTFVNVQTMVHHGSMIVIATVILAGKHSTLSLKSVLKGSIVYAICVALGLMADIAAVKIFNIQETFNMFFISPYFECPMPVFNIIYNNAPYIVFLAAYLFGFITGTFIVTYGTKGIILLVKKIFKKKESTPPQITNQQA